MRSLLAGLRTLTLPWGAAPTQPAIVIGPDIPPIIAADPFGNETKAAIVYRAGPTVRHFDAVAGDGWAMRLWSGTWDDSVAVVPADVIWHTERRAAPGLSPLEYLQAYGDFTKAPGALDRLGHRYGSDCALHIMSPTTIETDSTNPDYGDWTIDGASMARGGIQGFGSQAPTAAIGNVETDTDTFPVTWKAGRAYRLHLYGRASANATAYMLLQLRRGALAGPLLHQIGTVYVPAGGLSPGIPVSSVAYVANSGAVDVAENVLLTQRSTAVGVTVTMLASATQPRGLMITDVGSAAQYAAYAIAA